MKRNVGFARFVLLVNGLVPGSILLWDAWNGQAGANPVNYAIRTTGMLALVFLTLSLAVTPLRKITGKGDLFYFRRPLGLFAFFYALTHFSIFFFWDRQASIRSTFSEMVKRPYLIVGSVALLILIPMAATSFNSVIKWMGAKRWKALHKRVYFVAILAVTHYYLLVKSDVRVPLVFAAVVGTLLLYRLVNYLSEGNKEAAKLGQGLRVSANGQAAKWFGKMRVDKIIQETDDVRTFRLKSVEGNGLPFAYQPGQYLTLALDVAGKPAKRTYTIASSPSRPECCEVTIKRETLGKVSGHMHSLVKEGDLLDVSAPSGKFIFDGNGAGAVALIAGGVGITPLMSMLRYLTDNKWVGRIYLLYSNKRQTDIIFRRELDELQRTHPNLNVTLTLTREEDATWTGKRGRIDAAMLTEAIPNVRSVPFYMCGPGPMLQELRPMLINMGVEKGNIVTESFGTTSTARSDDEERHEPGQANTVTFSRSKRSAITHGEKPLLDVAEDLGIQVDSECRAGICGTCKCRLVSGRVKMEIQEALDESDRENGMILLCQARPLEDVTVEA